MGGVPVARILGIEVRVSYAWAFLVGLVSLIGSQQASAIAPAAGGLVHWLIGLVVALAFLATVIVHELAHALVGRRRGVPASTVQLGFIGGVSPLSIEASRPRDELFIALAGPMASLAIGAVATPAAMVADGGAGPLRLLGGGLLVVGGLNLVFALLSLLPGMPLDGGRVVRALAWAGTHDRDRASHLTVVVGRIVGWGLVGLGAVMAVADMVSGGIMTLGLGWFLASGSRTLDRRLDIERILRGAVVGDATRREIPQVGPNLTVDTFADRFAGPDRVSCLPVVEGERVLGVIGQRGLRRLGTRRFTSTRAAQVMATPPRAPFLAPEQDLWAAVEMMNARGLDGLAVVADDRLEGVVMRESIGELIQRRAGGAEAPAA